MLTGAVASIDVTVASRLVLDRCSGCIASTCGGGGGGGGAAGADAGEWMRMEDRLTEGLICNDVSVNSWLALY